MVYLLYGPPGIGKSTLVEYARSKNYPAVDLEKVEPAGRITVAKELADDSRRIIVGAADINPRVFNNSRAVYVCLYLNSHAYKTRRKIRDASNPSKSGQPELTIDQFIAGSDYVVSAKGSVKQVFKRILNVMRFNSK